MLLAMRNPVWKHTPFNELSLSRIDAISAPSLQELSVVDDTVLEEHCEDPLMVQMRLLGDGSECYDFFVA